MAAEAGTGDLEFYPMDQFLVKPLFGGDTVSWYTPTNVTLWMGLAVLAIILLLVIGTRRRAIVPNRTQSITELAYGFVHSMIEDVAGKDALKYFPYIMTLFIFIVFSNFLGMLPMSFATTSHIAVTVVLAMLVFVSVTLLGFYLHGFKHDFKIGGDLFGDRTILSRHSSVLSLTLWPAFSDSAKIWFLLVCSFGV